MRRTSIISAIALAALSTSLPANAQSPKPHTPGEIAAASQKMAEKYESCRGEANAQKLHLLKRQRFLRDCKKSKI